MKLLPPSLQSHLDSGTTTLAWCWRITRRDGDALRLHRSRPRPRLRRHHVRGRHRLHRHRDQGAGRPRASTTWRSPAPSSRIASQRTTLRRPLRRCGRRDLARQLGRTPTERVLMRSGSLGEVRRTGTAFTAEVRGLAHYLQQPKGRLFQYGCDADLGDARCGIDLTSPVYRGEGAIVTALSARLFTANGLATFDDAGSRAASSPSPPAPTPAAPARSSATRSPTPPSASSCGSRSAIRPARRHVRRHRRLRQALRHLRRQVRQRRQLSRLPAHARQRLRRLLSPSRRYQPRGVMSKPTASNSASPAVASFARSAAPLRRRRPAGAFRAYEAHYAHMGIRCRESSRIARLESALPGRNWRAVAACVRRPCFRLPTPVLAMPTRALILFHARAWIADTRRQRQVGNTC